MLINPRNSDSRSTNGGDIWSGPTQAAIRSKRDTDNNNKSHMTGRLDNKTRNIISSKIYDKRCKNHQNNNISNDTIGTLKKSKA